MQLECKRELDWSLVNSAKVCCVAHTVHFPLGWVKCEIGIGVQSYSFCLPLHTLICPPLPWFCTGWGKKSNLFLLQLILAPAILNMFVCVCAVVQLQASGPHVNYSLFSFGLVNGYFCCAWGGMWLRTLSGQEGPEFDSFPKASVLTTEKLQEGDAVIQSISIDHTKSVFKIFLSFFFFFF